MDQHARFFFYYFKQQVSMKKVVGMCFNLSVIIPSTLVWLRFGPVPSLLTSAIISLLFMLV